MRQKGIINTIICNRALTWRLNLGSDWMIVLLPACFHGTKLMQIKRNFDANEKVERFSSLRDVH